MTSQATTSFTLTCFANTQADELIRKLAYLKHVLTGPDEAHHIICCNCNAFRSEAIFHGWISLHNVSSLSHSSDVVDVGTLEFWRKETPWFK